MNKFLKVEKYGEVVYISITEELDHLHKDEFYMSQSGIEKLADKVSRIAEKAKTISGYQGVSVNFSTIDWYDSCNSFKVPYISLVKGKRKPVIEYNTYNDIPKDWEQNIRITTTAKTVASIVKNIKILLGYNINEEQVKQLRATLKRKGTFLYEL